MSTFDRLVVAGIVAGAWAWPGGVTAQDFLPPEQSARSSAFFVGLEGFTTRFGIDVTDENQAVIGVGLDLGNVGSDRFRFRSIAEIGFGTGTDTYVIGADVVYRFTPDTERAVPYVGIGPGVFTAEDCAAFADCPKVWAQFTIGFELRLRQPFNWLLEYRAEDAFGRHRLFVGLTTRRGG